MKKMLITLPKMSMGGMERSCANLLKVSNLAKNFDITLLIGYVVDSALFENLPDNVKVKVLCKGKWNIFGKISVVIKYIFLYLKLLLAPSSFDVSICYSHHHSVLSRLTRAASRNSICFIHSDLQQARTKKQVKAMHFDKFKRIACVSNAAKATFMEIFPNYSNDNIFIVNNYIDGEKIERLSKCKIEENLDFSKTTFINISRHLESAKKISRLLEAAKLLKSENYDFQILLVGDGPDFCNYTKYITDNHLEDVIITLGIKTNPYNYLINSDALVLPSLFEGYGMVLDEARVLGVPVITTDVADAKLITDAGYGILCENSTQGVYSGLKEFLNNKFASNKKFSYINFNEVITNNIDKLISFND